MSKNLAEERMLTAREAMTSAYPPPPGTEPGGLPVRKLLSAVFRSRTLLIFTMAVGFAVGAFMAISTPNTCPCQSPKAAWRSTI